METYVQIEVRYEGLVGENHDGGDQPDERQDDVHVDPDHGFTQDHPPALEADGEEGEHDDVAGEVLQHGEEVTHGPAQQPVVNNQDEQRHRQSDCQLEQGGNHCAQDTTLDRTAQI